MLRQPETFLLKEIFWILLLFKNLHFLNSTTFLLRDIFKFKSLQLFNAMTTGNILKRNVLDSAVI